MACSCKHNQQRIEDYKRQLSILRDLFIKRMTIDSEHCDARRKDFNQAIFGYRDDGSTYACFSGTDMDMVLQCFDNAIKDYRRTFCDAKDCRRK
jgi:hypothetical protein